MYVVSIIIPVYNVDKYISQSLLSALHQTFDSIEYILVDDCGTDQSMEIVKNLVMGSTREKDVYICKHEQNQGLSAARNTGLERATGDYVFFMDSDDEISKDCIENHYYSLKNSNADFTVGNVQLQGASSLHIKPIPSRVIEGEDILKTYLNKQWLETAWNKLYKRTFLFQNNLKFIPGILHEDILWGYNLAQKAQKIFIIKNETYVYKIRKGSITSTALKKRVESLLFILNELYKDYDSTCFKIDFATYFSSIQFTACLLLISSTCPYNEKKIAFRKISFWNLHSGALQSKLLELPFWAFTLLLFLPYRIYKTIK